VPVASGNEKDGTLVKVLTSKIIELEILQEDKMQLGPNFLRCTKILSQYHLFLSFLPSPFYHVKTHLWMIMMESKITMV
jgi:hypothetical protein